MNFDWTSLAFASKKPLNDLNAVFIDAPRAISTERFKQLLKQFLPKANIILGLAKEPYVLGLEDQPQFRMLQQAAIQSTIDKVNQSPSRHKIYTLLYSQRETKFILEKLKFSKIVFINGSWHHVFHSLPPFYVLSANRLDYELISPFTGEDEAKAYEQATDPAIKQSVAHLIQPSPHATYTAAEMLTLARDAAKLSYDYTFQTGAVLGQKMPGTDSYQLITHAFNRVVPFQTYAMHLGASRERHFSPMQDLNHYDTNHAEVELIVKAQRDAIDLQDTTVFITLLPCPTCARMFALTDIAEIVYQEDHSAGYALKMLEAAGKSVRRLVS